jgi:para-nitrobenzyl esterase
VDTPAGRLRGTPLPDGGVLFAGIPFAAPPIGSLRLRPPHPPRAWLGVRDATRFRPAPPQTVPALMRGQRAAGNPSPPGSSPRTAETPSPAGIGPSTTQAPSPTASSPFLVGDRSEDCLYLNVWTPDLAGRRPVLAWIYGGGFDAGSAAPPFTDGAALSRLTGAVVVAANYRVGALGYLHLAGIGGPDWAGCSNLGLQDQAAALRWVRENIAAFGGDPGNITVAGESAGAFSIGSLLATPAAAGTFHRAILSSGSADRIFDADTGSAIATDLLAALGLGTVEGLLDVPVEKILAVQSAVVDADIGRRNLPGGRSWGVVLDGAVLPHHPRAAVSDGAAAGIGLLVGANREEVRLFQVMQGAAFEPVNEGALLDEMRRAGVASSERLLAGYRRRAPGAGLAGLRSMFLTDAVYRRPASALAAARAAAGGPVHAYLFSAAAMGQQLGACHGADLMLLFDRVDPGNRELLAVRDDLIGAWARFAATGDPGWPPYDPAAPLNTRQFGGTASMVTEPPADDASAAWPDPARSAEQGG